MPQLPDESHKPNPPPVLPRRGSGSILRAVDSGPEPVAVAGQSQESTPQQQLPCVGCGRRVLPRPTMCDTSRSTEMVGLAGTLDPPYKTANRATLHRSQSWCISRRDVLVACGRSKDVKFSGVIHHRLRISTNSPKPIRHRDHQTKSRVQRIKLRRKQLLCRFPWIDVKTA